MSNKLLISSVIVVSLLMKLPISVKAQSNSSCQNTINQVRNEIIEKGAKKAFIQTTPNGVSNRRNPTNRRDAIMVRPWPSTGDNINHGFSQTSYARIENILNSPVLMNYWANMIVKDCNNVAEIIFCMPQSDCVASFASSPDNKAVLRRQASDCRNYNSISWYEACYN